MPIWSSTENSFDSTWSISRSTGITTAWAASMTRFTSWVAMVLFRLETAIETRTAELVAEATGRPVTPAELVPTPGETPKV